MLVRFTILIDRIRDVAVKILNEEVEFLITAMMQSNGLLSTCTLHVNILLLSVNL
jgi:hypothetical protein